MENCFFFNTLTVFLDVCLQGFASKLARKHYKHALKLSAWNAWRSVIESKWKQRVEKACQVINEQEEAKIAMNLKYKCTGLSL